jgi:hypothetical protein
VLFVDLIFIFDMGQPMELKVTEVNGWSKVIDLKKAITRIGSAPTADIQLPSNSIAPLHLQILSDPDLPTGCRVVNMAGELEVWNNGSAFPFSPFATHNISDKDEIQLGEYRLAFSLPFSAAILRSSTSIEASLTFSDSLLQPGLPLDGLLLVKNTGGRDACQFQVTLSGLPEDCCRIDPIPLLYPGAQEEVRIRLFHNITYPQPGLHELLLAVNAPLDYPGEEFIIRQGIYVAPVFRQTLEVVDDLAPSSAEAKREKAQLPTEDQALDEAVLAPRISAEQASEEMIVEAETEERLQSFPLRERELELDRRPPLPEAGVESETPLTERVAPQPASLPELATVEEQPIPIPPPAPEPGFEGENIQSQAWEEERAGATPVQVEQQPALEPLEIPPLVDVEPTVVLPKVEDKTPESPRQEQHVGEKAAEIPPAAPQPPAAPKPPKPTLTVRSDALDPSWADEPPPEKAGSTASGDLNLSKVKVARTREDNFWDES